VIRSENLFVALTYNESLQLLSIRLQVAFDVNSMERIINT